MPIRKTLNLMARVSHELRTPLNSIISLISLISGTNLTQEQERYLELLSEASFGLLKLVNDILDISCLENGVLKLNNTIFHAETCIKKVVEIVKYKAVEKNINLSFKIDDGIPDFITGDPGRIKQILINLVYNSIKFSETNSDITTIVKKVPCKNNNNSKKIKLLFNVVDSGSGIKPENFESIFNCYNTARGTNIENNEGIGLGLSISKELVCLMGGDIWVEKSIPFKETNIGFYIVVQSSSESSFAESLDNSSFISKNVLVIDDNHINRLKLCDTFMKWGMFPIPCSSAEEAMLFVKKKKFDIIITDIRLPREDGVSIGKKIKKINKVIPLIAMSSVGDNIGECYKDIFDFFVIKPVKDVKIFAIFNEIFTLKKISPEPVDYRTKIKILVDEDIYLNRIVITSLLNKLGFTNVKTVANSSEAIDILKSNFFDVCFINITTPKISGYEVLKWITKNQPKIKTVAMASIPISKEYEFSSVLCKPIDLKDIQKVLFNWYQDL